MSIYIYRRNGRTIEVEFPIGTAPKRVVRKGREYERVLVAPVVRMKDTGKIVAHSIQTRDVMPRALQEHVDGWTPDGTAVFDSPKTAKTFAGKTRKLWERGKIDAPITYGDAPSGAEVRAARKRGEVIR